ncbi:putative ThiJ/PfpI family transcriptional regulator [Talaromyces proteolyticus]|uniref:ThiJ/PfpI family transcriptional regulator n=1 Tax=Talaromyces proteolyticus TaxID=1131652 RepID=A0AAD4KGU3_9EURO|nr:putative ThiJ/PfpI family transcriptional regulator [Talaromyces proteolyticus]KAH8691451.1 putative ThiJ/PfpI family transcriptional regulator [Talaromyces proteolyticus]
MAPIQFGIVLYDFQALDVVGPIDILYAGSKDLLDPMAAAGWVTNDVASAAIDIKFHYIAPTMDAMQIMSGLSLNPSTTFDKCPKLDCLLIGGPGPEFWNDIPESYAKFLTEKAQEVDYFFATCTGGVVAAKVGLLKNKRATTNSTVLSYVATEFPETKWEKSHWVVDGKFWTAGSSFSGIDMIEHWVKGRRGEAAEALARESLDWTPRDINGKYIQ